MSLAGAIGLGCGVVALVLIVWCIAMLARTAGTHDPSRVTRGPEESTAYIGDRAVVTTVWQIAGVFHWERIWRKPDGTFDYREAGEGQPPSLDVGNQSFGAERGPRRDPDADTKAAKATAR